MVGQSFSLEKSSERVIGELPVVSHLSMGYEKLTLFFTDRRIIVSHGGKVGAGSVPATFMFGSIGSSLSGLFGRGKAKSHRLKSQYMSPARILASNKNNFSVSFDEVVNVDIIKTPSTSSILILSSSDKFDLTSRSKFEHVKSLFENSLGSKVRIHHKDE